MGISNFTLKRIFKEIEPHLIQAKIERILNISDHDYLFTLYSENKTYPLLLSLDANLPCILKASEARVDVVRPVNQNCILLRKYLDHATILSAQKIENDRIILLGIQKWTPSYQLLHLFCIIELFPLSPNVIFVNEEYQIVDALKISDSLDSKHPIYKNLHYEFPLSNDKTICIDTPLEELKNKVSRQEFRYLSSLSEEEYHKSLGVMLKETSYYYYQNEISSLPLNENARKCSLEDLFSSLLETKTTESKKNHYQDIYKLVEQKIKSAKKRLLNLEQDRLHFLNASEYQEKGNLLYLATDTYKKGMKKIIVENQEILLDPKLDLYQNAQKYFKLYKKAKSGLVQIEHQKQVTQDEIDYFQNIQTQLPFARLEEMNQIILDLTEHHYLKNQKVQNKAKKQPGNKRYNPHYLYTEDHVKIGYGLSSYQNEELTFSVARKEDYYLHIKDYHGPHVILFDEHPSEENLLFAGEVALYFAGKTSGEVYYTKRKNVKKVPEKRGLVTMEHMSLMVISSIREETKNKLNRQ